jgi:hypothetical protein
MGARLALGLGVLSAGAYVRVRGAVCVMGPIISARLVISPAATPHTIVPLDLPTHPAPTPAQSELGIPTVGIYSKEDHLCPHRYKADESYLVRPVPAIVMVAAASRPSCLLANTPGPRPAPRAPRWARTQRPWVRT